MSELFGHLSMGRKLLLICLLTHTLLFANAWPAEMITDNGCLKASTEGTTLMGHEAILDSEEYVIVKRDGIEIPSGSNYVSGESLTVLFTSSDQFILEVKYATFTNGYCSDTRATASESELVMPVDGSMVYIWASFASGYSAVSVSSLFTLIPISVTDVPTASLSTDTESDGLDWEDSPTLWPTALSPTLHPTDKHPTHFPTVTAYPTESAPTIYPTESGIQDEVITGSEPIEPTAFPTELQPTAFPTELQPTPFPTESAPTQYPTPGSVEDNTFEPTAFPTELQPTAFPTELQPTPFPTELAPTQYPTPGSVEDNAFEPTMFPTYSSDYLSAAVKDDDNYVNNDDDDNVDDDYDYSDVDEDDDSDRVSLENVSKPNFVFILADDLGFNSLGYSDESKEYISPTLTALAKQGIIMSNFYAQEVCTPSRASLLVGRYPLSMGMQYGMVQPTAAWGLTIGETTIAEVLSDEGYSTNMLGKWHLGYFSPLLLPTARGFDTFLGYLNGDTYYWSKRNPDSPEFHDLAVANKQCFNSYNESDMQDYSTTFYTNHALELIEKHDQSVPLFLLLSYQAVHDPFVDIGQFRNGMPETDKYIPSDVREMIHNSIVGKVPQEYYKSLYMLDNAVSQIYDKLDDIGMLDSTYIIFMSDNGGCHYGGGKNGPLRGVKGSLFEGGTKVESFIYSPLLKRKLQGSTYDGLMHVSDWFPTILSLANITYSPDPSYSLDGVNQSPGWLGRATPRTTMLYNMHIDITGDYLNWWHNGSMAVRNERYKLIHTYDDADYGAWYDAEIEYDFDLNVTNPDGNRCNQEGLSGNFSYFLFDLFEDPYETNNLYYSEDDDITTVKDELYELIPDYESKSTTKKPIKFNKKVKEIWQERFDWHMLPYIDYTTDTFTTRMIKHFGGELSYPEYCSVEESY